jgi:hypothetical protein
MMKSLKDIPQGSSKSVSISGIIAELSAADGEYLGDHSQ